MDYQQNNDTNITLEGVITGMSIVLLLGLVFLPKVFNISGRMLQGGDRKR